MTGTPSRLSAELLVRSQAPFGVRDRQRAAIDELDRLEGEGTIDEYDVHLWGAEVCLEERTPGTSCDRASAARLLELRQWADAEGVSLDGAFRRADRAPTYFEDHASGEVVSLPVLALVVYRGDSLQEVYPSTRDGESRSVTDGLRTLSADAADG